MTKWVSWSTDLGLSLKHYFDSNNDDILMSEIYELIPSWDQEPWNKYNVDSHKEYKVGSNTYPASPPWFESRGHCYPSSPDFYTGAPAFRTAIRSGVIYKESIFSETSYIGHMLLSRSYILHRNYRDENEIEIKGDTGGRLVSDTPSKTALE